MEKEYKEQIGKIIAEGNLEKLTARSVRESLEKHFKMEKGGLDKDKALITKLMDEALEEQVSQDSKEKKRKREDKKKEKKEDKKDKETENKKKKESSSEEEEEDKEPKKKAKKSSKGDDPKKTAELERLKKIIRQSGMKVPMKLGDLSQDDAIKKVSKQLEEAGLGTHPSKEAIQDMKEKNDLDSEVDHLKSNKIIGDLNKRVTRGRTLTYTFQPPPDSDEEDDSDKGGDAKSSSDEE